MLQHRIRALAINHRDFFTRQEIIEDHAGLHFHQPVAGGVDILCARGAIQVFANIGAEAGRQLCRHPLGKFVILNIIEARHHAGEHGNTACLRDAIHGFQVDDLLRRIALGVLPRDEHMPITGMLLVEVVRHRLAPCILFHPVNDPLFLVIQIKGQKIRFDQLQRIRHQRAVIDRGADAFNMFHQHFTVAKPAPGKQAQHLVPIQFPRHFREAHPFFPQFNQLVVNLFGQLAVFALHLWFNRDPTADDVIDEAIQHTTRQIMVFVEIPRLQAQRFSSAFHHRITAAMIHLNFTQARRLGGFIGALLA